MLSDTQKIEAGNESWKATVIAIRDSYLAQGLTAEEAMKDAEMLWQATGQGAEASQAAVDLVNQKMKGMAEHTASATQEANQLKAALEGVQRAADAISLPSGGGAVAPASYQHGPAAGISNFGQGTLAMLHGRERAMTEGETTTSDPAMIGALQAIRRDLQRQPELIALQLRAALAQV